MPDFASTTGDGVPMSLTGRGVGATLKAALDGVRDELRQEIAPNAWNMTKRRKDWK